MGDLPDVLSAMIAEGRHVVRAAGVGSGLTGLVRAFLDFEEENDLFSAEARGRRFWDCIRSYVFQRLLNSVARGPALAETTGAARWRRLPKLWSFSGGIAQTMKDTVPSPTHDGSLK